MKAIRRGVAVAATCLLVTAGLPASEAPAADPMLSLDGRVEEAEAAPALADRDGAALAARWEGSRLRVNVQSAPLHVASLCVGAGDRVHVLHASAALGALTYTRGKAGWTTSDSFDWGVRDTSLSKEAVASRSAYLAEHGWVATTVEMGEPGVTEFLIDAGRLPEGARLAVGLMTVNDPRSIVGLPAEPDGCADATLVAGDVPESPRFAPESWLAIPAR